NSKEFRDKVNGKFVYGFKGYLKYGSGWLPAHSLNFDLDFGGGTAEDATFFETNTKYNVNDNMGCEVERQYFGVVLRANYTIPEGEGGVYIFTIGSDDGSFLRVVKNGTSEAVHDNWKEGKTYVYEENIINNYREYEQGDVLEFHLSYYEIKG